MAAVVDAPAFCAAPADHAPHLAILGVLSAEPHTEFRRQLRATWMDRGLASRGGDGTDIQARFVMRGLGLRSATLEEATLYGDTVFVEAPSSLGRSSGPLTSLLLWLRCATTAWPRAQLIGKADDDVWADLERMAALLRASLDALSRTPHDGLPGLADAPDAANATVATGGGGGGAASSVPHVLFGQLEQYSWDEEALRPTKWGGAGWFDMANCRTAREPREPLLANSLRSAGLLPPRRRAEATGAGGRGGRDGARGGSHRGGRGGGGARGTAGAARGASAGGREEVEPAVAVTGPFAFPKGPMYFASKPLVDAALAVPATHAVAAAAVRPFVARGANASQREREAIRPWEDVYTGLALARLARAAAGRAPTLVHLGCAPFTQSWGFFMTKATALWHTRAKSPERIGEAHAWASRNGCELPLLRMECAQTPWRACDGGAAWRRCFPYFNTSACSTKMVNLLPRRRFPARRPECWTQERAEREAGKRTKSATTLHSQCM